MGLTNSKYFPKRRQRVLDIVWKGNPEFEGLKQELTSLEDLKLHQNKKMLELLEGTNNFAELTGVDWSALFRGECEGSLLELVRNTCAKSGLKRRISKVQMPQQTQGKCIAALPPISTSSMERLAASLEEYLDMAKKAFARNEQMRRVQDTMMDMLQNRQFFRCWISHRPPKNSGNEGKNDTSNGKLGPHPCCLVRVAGLISRPRNLGRSKAWPPKFLAAELTEIQQWCAVTPHGTGFKRWIDSVIEIHRRTGELERMTLAPEVMIYAPLCLDFMGLALGVEEAGHVLPPILRSIIEKERELLRLRCANSYLRDMYPSGGNTINPLL